LEYLQGTYLCASSPGDVSDYSNGQKVHLHVYNKGKEEISTIHKADLLKSGYQYSGGPYDPQYDPDIPKLDPPAKNTFKYTRIKGKQDERHPPHGSADIKVRFRVLGVGGAPVSTEGTSNPLDYSFGQYVPIYV
jgi:hypothetical protein